MSIWFDIYASKIGFRAAPKKEGTKLVLFRCLSVLAQEAAEKPEDFTGAARPGHGHEDSKGAALARLVWWLSLRVKRWALSREDGVVAWECGEGR